MLAPYPCGLYPQGCYEKVKMWFDDNKHVLGTVGMCILIMQVRGGAEAEPMQEQTGGPAPRRPRPDTPHP